MDLSINVVDDVLMRTMMNSPQFKDFCENIETINSLLDQELYIEDVENLGSRKQRVGRSIVKNTVDTTKGAGAVYGMATDAGGALIKSGWDLMIKLMSLIVRIIKFVVFKVVEIPNMIGRLIDGIQKIPSEIKMKIRGNIKLYITTNDIEILYNQGLYLHLDTFLKQCEMLSSGVMWTTMFRKTNKGVDPNINFDNDMKLCNNMKKEYDYFRKVKFKQVEVDMNDPNTVELYFSNKKMDIHTVDGKVRQCTYYEALEQLIKDINSRKNTLKMLQSDLGDKFETTQANQDFAKLSQRNRQRVIDTIQMVSGTVSIIGNMIKCMMTDINTIQKTTTQIIKRKNSIDSGTAKKKIVGRSDKVIKDLEVNERPQNKKQFIDNMKANGYMKVERLQRDARGNIVDEIKGIVDEYDDDHVWILKSEVPKGVKVLR